MAVGVRHLLPEELQIVSAVGRPGPGEALRERPIIILVGLTGAGKTTTVGRLQMFLPLAAVLPDRRALTDRLILPMMTGSPEPVADRVERFRLTAAFKERHPGGMGDVLGWLLLPPGLPAGPILFDGLRGEAEVAAAASLPDARFLVLECSPQGRLRRLCGRDDPFDRAAVGIAEPVASDAVAAVRRALAVSGFDTLVTPAEAGRMAAELARDGTGPGDVARKAAIIVEESRHYDPSAARAALLQRAPSRTLVIDTDALGSDQVAATAVAWSAAA